MRIKTVVNVLLVIALLSFAVPLAVNAADKMDFKLDNTRQLFNLCAVSPDDPLYIPAIYACRGFIEAAVQYHDAVSDRKHLKRLICYESDTSIEDGRLAFVDWAQAHQEDETHMTEQPVIGLVRALAEKYPCEK